MYVKKNMGTIKKSKKINKYSKHKKTLKRKFKINLKLLKELTSLHTPTGEEEKGVDFLLKYINKNKRTWKHKPKIIHNENTKNNIILVFGKPKTAIMSHIDNVGFIHTGTNGVMLDIGGVEYVKNAKINGYVNNKKIETELKVKNKIPISKEHKIPIGTNFTYSPKWNITNKLIKSTNLDNKVGVYICLELAKTLKDGILIFTCGEEEPMSGDIPYLTRFIYETYNVKNVLILDTTSDSNNIDLGKGTVVTFRDYNIYKRAFVNKIIHILSGDKIQKEVVNDGSSDGEYVLSSPYPMNVAFLGIPIQKIHTNQEIIHKDDIKYTFKNVKKIMTSLK